MAFLQETPQPFFRVPVIVPLLIAVLVGIELSREFLWEAATRYAYFSFGFVPELYSRSFLAAHNVHPSVLEFVRPFFTYTFLHGSFTHVTVNSIWLLAFGPLVARRYGSMSFLVYFLLCGAGGAAAELISAWGSDAPVIGASAAVSGLMGAAFRIMGPRPLQQAAVPAPLLSRRIVSWSVVWLGVNVVAGVLGLGAGPGVQTIAWQAHIGGYLAGLLLIDPFDALTRRSRHQREEPAL